MRWGIVSVPLFRYRFRMSRALALTLLLGGIAASVTMYVLGADGNLTELRDFCLAPLPIALIGLISLCKR